MGYYARLIGAFIRTAIQQETASRANFLVNLLQTGLNFVAGIVGIVVLFGQVETIQGWTLPQALTLLGVYMLVGALQSLCIGPSLDSLGGLYGEVWQGSFDFTLLKPADTQFLVSLRRWRLWAVVDLVLSLAVLGKGLIGSGPLTVGNFASFLAALVVAIAIVYGILLLLASTVFWYRGVPLMWIFGSLFQMGRYPIGIYPGWLRLVLTWVIPVGFITTVPAEALSGRMSVGTWMSGVALAVVLLAAGAVFFRVSLRRYTGASG